MKSVTFSKDNLKLKGNLYLPEGFSENEKFAAIITVHPGGGVKEQTSGLYASSLAKEGFVTLAFDASYQGESEGEPRHLENPYERIDDISAAIDYLTTLKFVDPEKIGLLGICSGGGYAVSATINDRRVKALGTVNTVNYGDILRFGWDGTESSKKCLTYLEIASEQRSKEAKGDAIEYIPIAPLVREDAIHEDLAELYDYYRTPRGQHINAPSKLTKRSLSNLVTYDAFLYADVFLTQPLQIIVGSEGGARWMSEELNFRAASLDKDFHIVEGATHIDLYDRPNYVLEAVAKLSPFFKRVLLKKDAVIGNNQQGRRDETLSPEI